MLFEFSMTVFWHLPDITAVDGILSDGILWISQLVPLSITVCVCVSLMVSLQFPGFALAPQCIHGSTGFSTCLNTFSVTEILQALGTWHENSMLLDLQQLKQKYTAGNTNEIFVDIIACFWVKYSLLEYINVWNNLLKNSEKGVLDLKKLLVSSGYKIKKGIYFSVDWDVWIIVDFNSSTKLIVSWDILHKVRGSNDFHKCNQCI